MDIQKAIAKVADIDNRALEQLLLDILNACQMLWYNVPAEIDLDNCTQMAHLSQRQKQIVLASAEDMIDKIHDSKGDEWDWGGAIQNRARAVRAVESIFRS